MGLIDQSLPNAKAAARDLLAQLADSCFLKAEEEGFRPDPTKNSRENAVLLLKTGLPLAIMEPPFAALLD